MKPRPSWITLPEILGTTADAIFAKSPAVVVHFWADWNSYDMTMARRLDAIRGRFAGRAGFFACDVDVAENLDLCRRLGIVNVPWLVVFRAGKPGRRLVGLHEPGSLAESIEAELADDRPAGLGRSTLQ